MVSRRGVIGAATAAVVCAVAAVLLLSSSSSSSRNRVPRLPVSLWTSSSRVPFVLEEGVHDSRHPEHSRKIFLTHSVLDTRSLAPIWETQPDLFSTSLFSFSAPPSLFLVHFDKETALDGFLASLPALSGRRLSVQSSVVHYVPHNTLLMRLTPSQLSLVRGMPGVIWAGSYTPQFKVAPALSDYMSAARSFPASLPPRLSSTFTSTRRANLNGPTRDVAGFYMNESGVFSRAEMSESSESLVEGGSEATALRVDITTVPLSAHEYRAVVDSIEAHFAREHPVLRVTLQRTELPESGVLERPRVSLRVHAEGDLQEGLARIDSALRWVAEHDAVLWMAPKMRMGLKNQYARYVTQTGQPPASSTDYNTKFYNAGIRGRGAIVGVGDTGVTTTHCFFTDSGVATPFNTVSSTHRKFVDYVTTSGDNRDDDGHGSHVVGSVAGADLTGQSNIDNGMAPDAKIFFYDLSVGTSGSLNIPNDLRSQYFQLAYNAGARIHSNSWGCARDTSAQVLLGTSNDCNMYDSEAADIDDFTNSHPDFLVLYAAGNDGDFSLSKTLGSPATAKNTVTVGASSNTYQSWQDYGGAGFSQPTLFYNEGSLAFFSGTGPTIDGRIKPDVLAPGFQIKSTAAGTTCSLLLESGTSMATPVTAGTSALVYQYFADGFYPTGSAVAANKFAPPSGLIKAVLINGAIPLQRRQFVDTSAAAPTSLGGLKELTVPTAMQTFTPVSETGRTYIPTGQLFTVSGNSPVVRITPPAGSASISIRSFSTAGNYDLFMSDQSTVSATTFLQSATSAQAFDNMLVTLPLPGHTAVTDSLYVFIRASSTSARATFATYTYASTTPPTVINAQCTTTASNLPTDFIGATTSGATFRYVVKCPPVATCLASTAAVIGTQEYAASSSICRAAIHYGILSSSRADQTVILNMGPPRGSSYSGSTSNGVTSQNGASDNSGTFTLNTGSGASAPFDTQPTDGLPTNVAGYGVVNIGAALPLSGSGQSNTLVVHSNGIEHALAQGEARVYCFTTTQPGSNLKFTLVWHDAPSGAGTTGPALINDLDLTVVPPTGAVLKGNGGSNYDRANTVEQVVVQTPSSAGKWCIWVNATKCTVRSPQKFAMITTGVSLGTLTTDASVQFGCQVSNNCYTPPSDVSAGAVAGGVIGAVFVIGVAVAAVILYRRKQRRGATTEGAQLHPKGASAAVAPVAMKPAPASPRRNAAQQSTAFLVQQQAPVFNAAPAAGRPLPPGWALFVSDEGYPYYYNASTGQSTWDPPTA